MKKVKTIGIAIFIIAVLSMAGFVVIAWWLGVDDDRTPPKLPTKSVQNSLVLASNGCCFWVENVKVSLQDNDGNVIEISNIEAIYKHEIFKYNIPDFPHSPIKVVVEFRSFYGDEADFSLPVIEYESIAELNETGILLYFQEHDDMYLNVIAGDYHASYKMGKEENRWALMDTPNTVYE